MNALPDHISLLPSAASDLQADGDGAYLWQICLDGKAAPIREMEGWLSPEEIARAARFRTGQARNRFVAARGSLRAVLAYYLNTSPRQVPIAYTAEKKPWLAEHSSPHFNLSHSGGLALLAVSPRSAVGIDLERLRTDFAADALARRYFSPAECAALSHAAPQDTHRTFLALWTRKEAYLKAVGTGLRVPLNRVCVSADSSSVLLLCPDEAPVIAPYRIAPLHVPLGYVAALALAGLG